MKSKKRLSKEAKYWVPTERMYKACSYCFENDIKAYVVLEGDGCVVELNYKGKIKKGKVLYNTQREAGNAIWVLYETIFLRSNKNS
tara:strand:+ start:4 stop:261 length:258 start_codon:yes stop_codon:yes gene_type:complete